MLIQTTIRRNLNTRFPCILIICISNVHFFTISLILTLGLLLGLTNEYLQLGMRRDYLNLINAQATPKDLTALIALNELYADPFLEDIISGLKPFGEQT